MTLLEKKRLDMLLVDLNYFPSREKAQAAIMAGEIFVDGHPAQKPGTKVSTAAKIEKKSRRPDYVSRGGYKLKKALQVFNIDVQGKTVLDVGASTGGFTDCMLQAGAERVIAVDVGYGQLDWKLRKDPRVINLERTNIRHLSRADLEERSISLAVVDVSFISLKLVLPVLHKLDIFQVVALIKPQFEAGRERVGKGGVVRDEKTHTLVLQQVVEHALKEGYLLDDLSYSPIKGPKGNIEYLASFVRGQENEDSFPIEDLVAQAHKNLTENKRK